MTSNKIRSITTFFLMFFIIVSSKIILLVPSKAGILNKIAHTGFKCDFTDEHAKFENAFFIWIDKDNYKLIGLDVYQSFRQDSNPAFVQILTLSLKFFYPF